MPPEPFEHEAGGIRRRLGERHVLRAEGAGAAAAQIGDEAGGGAVEIEDAGDLVEAAGGFVEIAVVGAGVEVAPVERGERQQEILPGAGEQAEERILPVLAGIVVAVPVVGIALVYGDGGAVAQVEADIDLVGGDEVARPGREMG
ncbi:hypothetical protein [Shinella sp. BYT-45]|uniref:hypothetical protein n=1 Tax=Shinella sp. BYT-45 TaxID=3377377 RepID=UPI00398120EE